MKKFIINVLVFFTIVCIIDVGVGVLGNYLLEHAKGGSTKKLNDLVMKDIHDILIFGSSRAVNHYDAPLLSDSLGLDVYNAGYHGNGIVLAEGLLEMVLNRYHPKMVLYDVEPSFDIYEYKEDNNNIRYLKYLKPYYNQPGISNIIKDVSTEEWYKIQSGMIRYNTDIIPRVVDNVINRGTDLKGFIPAKGVMTEEPISVTKELPKVDSLKLTYLQKMITLCKESDVPIYFISSPKYGTKDSDILQPAKEIARKNHIQYWDYYSDSLFNCHKEWFKEPVHLNEKGAKEYSKLLVQRIAALLPDTPHTSMLKR